ncbi:MAG: DUF3108 domain-containing protein [Alphaproteobacteria bacterium]|nr:DUF3108 domain-containing protein [Alphaproteobacteria bacterium]
MQHRGYRGKIRYQGDAPVGERGREWFTVTVHGDGTRTLRSMCEMDDSQILRDVTYTMDRDWRPLDSFVRISVKDRFFGGAWFRFGAREVECEGFTAGEGRFSQRVAVDDWPRSFGPHPVVCDIWHLGAWNWKGPKAQEWPAIMSSPLPNGGSGPMIGRSMIRAEYQGEETVTVPAGTFRCKHFVFPLRESGHPPEHVWYTGPDLLFVKIRWDLLKTTYELTEISGDVGRE